jgi:hypothetical protein
MAVNTFCNSLLAVAYDNLYLTKQQHKKDTRYKYSCEVQNGCRQFEFNIYIFLKRLVT